nr:immunoglobulin heavy chain junction region [Macaca mulatta]MOV48030.1 immunoglobulin heavy chain junction region [Macaca mulatta]MOV48221.1 immunoglobulin heavy chain junction region [Macaca mulatta]MOV48289.1 immunoglobulin heavy chain junction region [Macaca mulatta]
CASGSCTGIFCLLYYGFHSW